jgi:AAA family ATP:ADP antiporter
MSSFGPPREARRAAAAFFLLLFSYYILRPLRETMGITGGLNALHWVMSASCIAALFLTPVFGFAAARLPRKVLVPGAYLFFVAQLAAFGLLMRAFPANVWVARGFVVWVSVFNLFVVSLFWSVMVDIFGDDDARKWFGIIASGGSAGALAGPLATEAIAARGLLYLLPLLSAALLCGSTLLILDMMRRAKLHSPSDISAPHMLEGALLIARRPYLRSIALFVFIATLAPTLLYVFQGHMVKGNFATPEDQTKFFAGLDFAVSVLTLGIQFFAAGPLLTRFGPAAGLVALPLFAAAVVALLAVFPVLGLFAAVQVLYRSAVYGIGVPSQEVLFTGLRRDEKYQAKNALETVIARAGDAAAAWLGFGLKQLWVELGPLAVAAVPCLAFTAWLGRRISEMHERAAALAPE